MQIIINQGQIRPAYKKRVQLLKQMRELGCDIILTGSEADFAEIIEAEGMTYKVIPFQPGGLNPVAELGMLRRYYAFLRQHKDAIVHSYTPKPNIYGTLAARMAGIRRIYPVVNGLGYAYIRKDFKAKCVQFATDNLYRVTFACADRVMFHNGDDAAELVRRGVMKAEKAVVISGSGVDLSLYPHTPTDPQGPILMANRHLVTKGTRVYYEAARLVKQKYPNAVFQLAGALDPNPDGITQEELESYVADGTITYLGNVSDMPQALRNCSVFVLPSYYREGIPHANLEALGTGRAIITTDAIGCRETINGKNGFMVPVQNAEALAEKMIWCIEHPQEVCAMGLESRRYAEERFDVKIVNHTILTVMGLLKDEK